MTEPITAIAQNTGAVQNTAPEVAPRAAAARTRRRSAARRRTAPDVRG
ncbi:hypothetical protein [Streptomyces sp. NPDC093094]